MRFDKFTTKLQQALSDAQSLAVGADNQSIEPQHLLLACSMMLTAAQPRSWHVQVRMSHR